jgi:hypothetical protein
VAGTSSEITPRRSHFLAAVFRLAAVFLAVAFLRLGAAFLVVRRFAAAVLVTTIFSLLRFGRLDHTQVRRASQAKSPCVFGFP